MKKFKAHQIIFNLIKCILTSVLMCIVGITTIIASIIPAQADILRPRNVVIASGAVLTAGYLANKQQEYRANSASTSRSWLGGANLSSAPSKLKLSDFFQPQYLRQNNDAGSNAISYANATTTNRIVLKPQNVIEGVSKWFRNLNPINKQIEKEIELQKAIDFLLGNNLRNNGSPERIAQLQNEMIESQNRLAVLIREKENPSANNSNTSKPQKRLKLERRDDGSSEWVEVGADISEQENKINNNKGNVLISPEYTPSASEYITANPAQMPPSSAIAINRPPDQTLLEQQTAPMVNPAVNPSALEHDIIATPEYEGSMKEGVYVKNDFEKAKELGYDRKVAAPRLPFNSHGQPGYFNGKTYISPDIDGHNVTNGWKMFDKKGERLGTFDENLNFIKD